MTRLALSRGCFRDLVSRIHDGLSVVKINCLPPGSRRTPNVVLARVVYNRRAAPSETHAHLMNQREHAALNRYFP